MQTVAASYYATSLPSMHTHIQQQSISNGRGNGVGIGLNGSIGSGASGSILLPAPSEPLRASVTHLLARAYNLPCTAAAQAFTQLVQPMTRFQLALDALLPLLSGNAEIPQRILASYILYSLYSSYPITMNPFRTAFIDVFSRERDLAKAASDQGVISDNEQLVWVLWKIMKGDGTDLGPYSPVTLARSPIPPKLRAPYLTIDDMPSSDPDPWRDSGEQSLNGVSSNGSSSNMSISSNCSNGHSPDKASASNFGSISPNGNANEAVLDEKIALAISLLQAATTRVLSLTEQRSVVTTIPHLPDVVVPANELPSLVACNPTIAYPYISWVFQVTSERATSGMAHQASSACLDALKRLSPTLPSFDVFGRLLRDNTYITAVLNDNPADAAEITVAQLIRLEVLGTFLLNAIEWIEKAENEEKEGLVSDDRASKAVQNLCRFFNSLIKLNVVDPTADTDSAAMAHFALNHSRFEEANQLYRVLVSKN